MTEKQKFETIETEVTEDKDLSSLELIWKLGFDELDAWAQRFNKQDELFLEAVRSYVDRIKHNQENFKEVSEQFNKELKEWEKAAREELLATTTTLQHFFPVKSYEEINKVVDDIQAKTTTLFLTPVRALSNGQALDQYLAAVEKYLLFRKNAREKYFESVKKTTNVFYENQKLFVSLITKQMKSAVFPFQKYMKDVVETTKS